MIWLTAARTTFPFPTEFVLKLRGCRLLYSYCVCGNSSNPLTCLSDHIALSTCPLPISVISNYYFGKYPAAARREIERRTAITVMFHNDFDDTFDGCCCLCTHVIITWWLFHVFYLSSVSLILLHLPFGWYFLGPWPKIFFTTLTFFFLVYTDTYLLCTITSPPSRLLFLFPITKPMKVCHRTDNDRLSPTIINQ